MTRRERLVQTLRGNPVDRPPVSFYEINGFDERPDDPDPYNIYSDPSWEPLLRLACERADAILMRRVGFTDDDDDPVRELTRVEVREEGARRFIRTTVRAGTRELTSLHRRDRDVNTVWTIEHLLKGPDDLRAWIELPEPGATGEPRVEPVFRAEEAVGEAGIVMIDTADPVCEIAGLFDLGVFTVTATTEPALMHRALEKSARRLHARTEAVARALPGRLWRIYGPEYATPPFLPPWLFGEYVSRYDRRMIESIRNHGGYARIHCHGRIRLVLDQIASLGAAGLDPIEPPTQGDVELGWVRERVGGEMVLFGNIEMSDLENLPTPELEAKVRAALRQGTGGRGFVLMPSSCPYGRSLSPRTVRNYERMVELAEAYPR